MTRGGREVCLSELRGYRRLLGGHHRLLGGRRRNVPGLFRLQVGSYGDRGLKILFLNVWNQSFYIPMDWMEIKQIHNNEIEWLPDSHYHG